MMRKWWWWTQWCWYHSNNSDGDNLTEEFLQKMQRTFGYHPYLSHRKPANFETWGEKHCLCIKEVCRMFSKNFLKSISFLTAIKIQILFHVQAQPLSGVAILNRRCGNVDVEIQRMKIFSQPPPPLLSMGTITQSSGGEPSLNVTFIFIPLLP